MARHRTFAASIALIAWAGLAIQFGVILGQHGSIPISLWIFFRFFTITTNLWVAGAFTAIAIGRPASPRGMTGLTLSILLVGIVYGVLLQGLHVLTGYAVLADILLHKVTPILVPLYWLGFVGKGKLRPLDPGRWAIYPFVYLFYALARGLAGDRYAYPFIDPTRQGWLGVGTNVAVIAIGFMIAGFGLYWLDGRLARKA